MATLILNRVGRLTNRFRKIKVFDGNNLIAELKDGETKENKAHTRATQFNR